MFPAQLTPGLLASLLLAGQVVAKSASKLLSSQSIERVSHRIETVTPELFERLSRYTAFSAGSYGDTCATPPFGSSVVKYFNNEETGTQGTLFRDDAAKEIVVAFRGTSAPKDLDTDFAFTLVPLNAEGTNCADCKVRRCGTLAEA